MSKNALGGLVHPHVHIYTYESYTYTYTYTYIYNVYAYLINSQQIITQSNICCLKMISTQLIYFRIFNALALGDDVHKSSES